jgi:anti-sigma-K factor RskA
MEADGIHELTAAYALNALDPESEREYEDHLRRCPRCREDLASLQEAAGALAFGVETPEPPKGLRDRIVDQARAERSNVVPLRRRLIVPTLTAAAAAAAGVAIGLGIWGATLSGDLDEERALVVQRDEVLALAFQPDTSHFPVSGANGMLVVASSGDAALVLSDLAAAPEGKTYEAWVIEEDSAPQPAGLFAGGEGGSIVRLTEPVPAGATVAVTLEPAGGVEAPTSEPLVVAPTV